MNKETKKETAMNIYEKIQAVSNKIGVLAKDMQVGNANYGYKALSDSQVIQNVNAAEKEFKIVSIPMSQELVSHETIKTIKMVKNEQKEVIYYVENIKMTTRLVNIEKPDEFLDVESFGKGLDSGDKGFGKASTYARKHGLLNAYKIASGEDLDLDKSEDTTPVSVNKKIDEIKDVLEKDTALNANIMTHFAVLSVDELTEDQVNTIYNDFKKKNRI